MKVRKSENFDFWFFDVFECLLFFELLICRIVWILCFYCFFVLWGRRKIRLLNISYIYIYMYIYIIVYTYIYVCVCPGKRSPSPLSTFPSACVGSRFHGNTPGNNSVAEKQSSGKARPCFKWQGMCLASSLGFRSQEKQKKKTYHNQNACLYTLQNLRQLTTIERMSFLDCLCFVCFERPMAICSNFRQHNWPTANGGGSPSLYDLGFSTRET